MKRFSMFAMLLVVASLVMAACAPAATPTPEPPKPQPTAMPEPTATPEPMLKDIVDTAVADGRFTTLVAAVGAAELVDTLKGEGPFTVFAPTDDAFAALPAGTVDELLKPENKQKLTDILLYHVVSGKVMAADAAISPAPPPYLARMLPSRLIWAMSTSTKRKSSSPTSKPPMVSSMSLTQCFFPLRMMR